MPRFVRTIIDQSLDKDFDYEVPDGMEVAVGTRVRLPFRNRTVLGTVIEVMDTSDAKGVRPIESTIGGKPMIPVKLVQLAHWMADYYCCPLPAAMRSVLPEVIRRGEMGFKQERFATLTKPLALEEIEPLRRRSARQAEVLEMLGSIGLPVAVSQIKKQCNAGPAVLKALENKGLIQLQSRSVQRDPYEKDEFLPTTNLSLSAEQQSALDTVLAAIKDPGDSKPILLNGVTGSGKTEVYLQAIEYVIQCGMSAIVLVPEIALTPQTVERFKARFVESGTEVAVLHSHLSAGERHDEWHKIHAGRARIVIGARSAVFAPLDRLGIIIVDEEHEHSYKQEEAPRYNARDVAVVRSRIEPCAVLLGSATPSLESYHNSLQGKYSMSLLNERADDRTMPLIRVVDMRIQPAKKGPIVLSNLLCRAIEDRLAKREQTILFLNRRGFSTALTCQECGYVCRCKHCSIPMTFHRAAARLVCHMCGHTQIVPTKCPECRDPKIRYSGAGTEKVEDAVAKIFPAAKVARMDADAMTRKEAYRETLGAFRRGTIDILIGTQMIAKGLHFPNVTLVGVVNADLTLHLPDFRAGERTFQLLTQVAGRAGRGEVLGEVYVQTYTPHSPSIQFARKADFAEFSNQELDFRKQGQYPPFTHFVLITLRSPNLELVEFSATTLWRYIKDGLPQNVILGEPAPAPLERLKGQYRFHLSLRTTAILKLSRHLRKILKNLTFPEDVHITVDVDPFSLM